MTNRPPDMRLADLFEERERLPLPAWAERYRYVTVGPTVPDGAEKTPWSNSTFPLQTAVMQALDDPRWARVVMYTAPQRFGKTDVLVNFMLERIHQRKQSVLYVAGRAELADAQWQNKLLPALRAHDELAELLPSNRDNAGDKYARRFSNGAAFYPVGADSVAALSGLTLGAVVGDDVQAMPAVLPGFSHPMEVARHRTGSMQPGRVRTVLAGTGGGAGDYLWRELMRTAVFCPFVRCPACGVPQMLEPERLEYDRENPEAARADTGLRCVNEDCGRLLRDTDLPALLRSAAWYSMPPGVNWITEPDAGGVRLPADAAPFPETKRRTSAAGFWCNALYWPFSVWGELAAERIAAANEPDKLKDFQQNIEVRPWVDPAGVDTGLEPGEIEAHTNAAGYRLRTVPDGVDLVVLSADVQHFYVYYIVRGWRIADGENWLIDIGSTRETSEDGMAGGLEYVARLAADGWPWAPNTPRAGEIMRPVRCVIDGGYKPEIVWRHCLRWGLRTWFPIKGSAAATHIWPQIPPPWVGGRQRWDIAVNEAKSTLDRLLRVPPGQPGYCHLPGDLAPQTLRKYCAHMTSEAWDERRRRWVRRRELGKNFDPGARGSRNDWWDCETYNLAAAISCGVKVPAYEWQIRGQRTPEGMTNGTPGDARASRPGAGWARLAAASERRRRR